MGNLASSGTPRISSNGFLTDPSRLRHPHHPARRCALTGVARGARARLRRRMSVGLAGDLGRPVRGAGRGVAGRLGTAVGILDQDSLDRGAIRMVRGMVQILDTWCGQGAAPMVAQPPVDSPSMPGQWVEPRMRGRT